MAPTTAPRASFRLVDATAASGVTFVHEAARTPDKHLPETMGAGVALIDFDLDGDLDLYFVQGKAAAVASAPSRGNELWRNEGSWRFTRVPRAAGAADHGLGMGACVGDVDSDGDADLFVTNVGPDRLYLNGGSGSFHAARRDFGDSWSASCTFIDGDEDGDLDLHVTAYVDYHAVRKNPHCGDLRAGLRAYCYPPVFDGVRDTAWRNDGRGGFVDATLEAGMAGEAGKGLGVIASDLDLDGHVDLFVANDSTPNALWRGDGRGRFVDVALAAGAAYDGSGKALAGMGVAAGDVDGNALTDVLITHLDLELNTLYRAVRPGQFVDASASAGLAACDHGWLGFGVELLDLDFDGDLDAYLANGHVMDNVASFNSSLTHAQPDQLLLNDGGGRFTECAGCGDVGSKAFVGRGSAAGDLDGDGDLDLVATSNGGAARLYRNDGTHRRPHLVLELRGTRHARDPIGARVTVLDRDGRAVARGQRAGASSYLSQGTPLVHAACPKGGGAVVVTWPGGKVERWDGLAPGRRHVLVEGNAKAAGR